MTERFKEALKLTLGNEGGYYAGTEARDPNPTNYGVTQQTYDDYRQRKGLAGQAVIHITSQEVEDIYVGYWNAASCELLPRLTALAVFDMAINAGPTAAVKLLQKCFTGLVVDGVFGPKTLQAVTAGSDWGTADAYSWQRVRFYVDLAKSERMRPNLLSWTLRVVQFREKYLT